MTHVHCCDEVDPDQVCPDPSAHERSAGAVPPPGTRLILAHENLLDEWGARTEDGRRITVEWGEPDEHGWYTPTFTKHERSAGAAPLDWDTLMKGAEIGYTYGALGRDFAQVLPELRRLTEGTDR